MSTRFKGRKKSKKFEDIIKVGRTHLQDATPISLGQEFSGYVSAIDHGINRLKKALDHCLELAAGGTAVGTGINTIEGFDKDVADEIKIITGQNFRTADNKFEAFSIASFPPPCLSNLTIGGSSISTTCVQ